MNTTTLPEKRNDWRNTKRLTITLLIVWFSLTFISLFFARELSTIHFFSWPLSLYMAAQGLTLSFVLILAIYPLGMRWITRTTPKEKH